MDEIMAGDWVKMRVWLSRDPRVIMMADWLAESRSFISWLTDPVRHHCKETAYEHVTREVVVAVCVSSLAIVWGTAREQGRRDGDDLVIDCCDLEALSALAGIPSFGDAMEFVGWAKADELSVTLARFFRERESPDDRLRAANAERQARFRDRKALRENVTQSNVTVTHREEKRRVTPPTPSKGEGAPIASFEEFWQAYPRKENKPNALRAWLRLDPDPATVTAIQTSLSRQRVSPKWKREDGRYIPLPANYLHGRRWEDAAVSDSAHSGKSPQERIARQAAERAAEEERVRAARESRKGRTILSKETNSA